ncbi:C-signal-like [Hyperolius riggenbachi]|uniref:C-signal-like n=1 Tax=Hyperolius riggenbachi TaxID=752182 RepID=UPI0035A30A55
MAKLSVHSVLITGSRRGVGLELVKAFLNKRNPPVHVFASCRNPEAAEELKFMASKYSNLTVIKLDVTDEMSIRAAYTDIEARLNGRGLNLLINNAGTNVVHAMDATTAKEMMKVYQTNVVGPMMVTQSFAPLLRKAAQENASKLMSCGKAAVINISSKFGSIDSISEELLPFLGIEYCCSKTALNMLTCCQAETYGRDGIVAIAITPGCVQTDTGGPRRMPTWVVQENVGRMMEVFDTLTEKHNGMFLDWKGLTVPW